MQYADHVDVLLRTAIKDKRLIRFVYHDKERIVEPHDYGVLNGARRLFGYQVAGSSSGKLPNWRLLDTNLISDLQLLDRRFPGRRPSSSNRHNKWDRLFIRVKPAGIGEVDQFRMTNVDQDENANIGQVEVVFDGSKN
jgi:hypothetical protein